MGGIAGTSRRTVICRRLADIGGFSGRAAVVLTEHEVAALPPLAALQLADAAHGGAPAVLRRQLLAALAGRALGSPVSEVRLVTDAAKRRMLFGHRLFASVSWRPGWVAAAIADTPVGIDVELVAEAETARHLAFGGLGDDPTMLAALHGPAGAWAVKEAALKANGHDLTSEPFAWKLCNLKVSAAGLTSVHIAVRRFPDAVVALAST